MHFLLGLVLFLIIQIPILYSLSEVCRYHIRMFGIYINLLLCAWIYVLICGPYVYIKDCGAHLAFYAASILSWWARLDVEVRNKKLLDEFTGPAILLSNHQSSIDLVVLGYYMPTKCVIMSKKSLKYIPGINFAALLAHTIFVDRTNKEDAQKSLDECCKIINDGNFKCFIYPEGTRHHDHGLLPFKKGAFNIAVNGQIPIIPCVISDYGNFYSKPKKYFNSNGKIIVDILEPIPTTGLGRDDVNDLAEKVRNIMIESYEKISAEVLKKT
uniref:1-acyl-sn-glycerol-3-phosphate acyltransferase n=1 Tax=Parastrongyloides trichosuri TaxID=131310 RepID=A0A0N4Z0P3_PARTI